MAQWSRKRLKLRKDDDWLPKPGWKGVVAYRGAVRFDIPERWVFEPGEETQLFRDCKPPDDTCGLQLTIFHLTAGVDWAKLSLSHLLYEGVRGHSEVEVVRQGPIITVPRQDLELVWTEARLVDPQEKREAVSRTCTARSGLIQPLMTMDFWPEDLARWDPVWHEILRSLRLSPPGKNAAGQTLH